MYFFRPVKQHVYQKSVFNYSNLVFSLQYLVFNIIRQSAMANEMRRISRQQVNSFFLETKNFSYKHIRQTPDLSLKMEQPVIKNGKIMIFKKLKMPCRQTKNSFVNNTIGNSYRTQRTNPTQKGQWVSSLIPQENPFKSRCQIILKQKHFQDKQSKNSYIDNSNSKGLLKNNSALKINSTAQFFRTKTQQSLEYYNNQISFNLNPKYSAYQKIEKIRSKEQQNNLITNQIENLPKKFTKNTVLSQQINSLAIDSNFALSPQKTFSKKNRTTEKQQMNKNIQKSFQQQNKQSSILDIFNQLIPSNEQKIQISKGKRQNNLLDNKKYISLQNIRSKDQSAQIPSLFFGKPTVALKKLEKNQTALKITKKDFTYIKKIGQGKFGSVFLVLHKNTNSIFAIKQVPKEKIKAALMVDQFTTQVKIQTFINHPNIVKIFGIFDDANKVYLILEYCEEGNLFNSLKSVSGFSQKLTKKYVSQIALGIEHLQDNQIFHRDLKPENIVLTYSTCKICDFGWATISQERRNTFCGTFDYVAPQIFQHVDYDKSIDLWALGILTYEMLFGKVPFYHPSRKQTIKRIINVQNQKLEFPLNVSNEAKSFIERLLQKNPEKRMTIAEVLKHSFTNCY